MIDLSTKLSMLNITSFLRNQIMKTMEESEEAKDINIYTYAYLKGKIAAYHEATEVTEINIARAEEIK